MSAPEEVADYACNLSDSTKGLEEKRQDKNIISNHYTYIPEAILYAVDIFLWWVRALDSLRQNWQTMASPPQTAPVIVLD